MAPIVARRRAPFSIAAAVVVVVGIAVARLPDSFIAVARRNSVLSGDAAGWALRLLALVATAQAVYGAVAILRPERVEIAMERDRDVAELSPQQLVTTLSRTAAAMVVLTIVYGLALVALTGERGGFWLFVLVSAAQGAWYYRECGRIAAWLDLRVWPAAPAIVGGAESSYGPSGAEPQTAEEDEI